MLNHQTFQLAEEHRRQLLCDAGADREDLIRQRLELHRSGPTPSSRPLDRLPLLGRRLQRSLIGWLAVIAFVACGTLGWAGPTGSSGHVIRNPGIGLHRLDTEQAQASDPAAEPTAAAGGYPPQERDVPELSSLLQSSQVSRACPAADIVSYIPEISWSGSDLNPINSSASQPTIVVADGGSAASGPSSALLIAA